MRELKQALNRAVEREAFEEAAVLRDKIRALEKKLGPGGE
ncbi:MAG: UvrB/UvrC motif-containing protein [bacterium]